MSAARPSVLEVLRTEQTPHASETALYGRSMEEDAMLGYLAQAAKQARVAAGRMPVHIAAEMSRDQATVYRFEKAEGWPRDPDLIIRAYAKDLEIAAIDLWARALELWREAATARDEASGTVPGLEDVHTQKTSKPARTSGRSQPSHNPKAQRSSSQ